MSLSPIGFSKPASTSAIFLSIPPQTHVFLIPSIDGPRLESTIHSSHDIPLTVSSVTVTSTQSLAAVPVILSGISASVASTLVLSSFLPVPSSLLVSVPAIGPASTADPFKMYIHSASVFSTPQPILPPAASSPAQALKVQERATFCTSPRKPVIALLRETLARRDAKFGKLNEAFLARKDRVLVWNHP